MLLLQNLKEKRVRCVLLAASLIRQKIMKRLRRSGLQSKIKVLAEAMQVFSRNQLQVVLLD